MSNEYKRSPSGLQVLKHMIVHVTAFSAAPGISSKTLSVPLDVEPPKEAACKAAFYSSVLLPVGVVLSDCIITSANNVTLTFVNSTAGALTVPANDWMFTTLHNPSLEGV